jgi:uncharacterized surface protein with fasciclin (FAS1) repeats
MKQKTLKEVQGMGKKLVAILGVLVFSLALFGGHAAAQEQKPQKDVVDTMRDLGSLKLFMDAVKAVYLVSVLQTPDAKFTIFAPNDEAFGKQPPGVVEDLFRPGNRLKLEQIVKFHIVREEIQSKHFRDVYTTKSMQGQELYFGYTQKTQTRMVNNARLVKGDIMATNGVIHIISRVLMPK